MEVVQRNSTRLGISYGYDRPDAMDAHSVHRLNDQEAWTAFYQRNANHFFKDRHWMIREWPVLFDAAKVAVCVELGCGVGNSLYPLMESSKIAHFYSCDFAPSAIAVLRQAKEYDPTRVTAYVADVCKVDQVTAHAPREGCDVALFIFVLSALALEQMPLALASARACLKKGGIVLVRDYCWGDAAQLRYQKTPSSRVLDSGLCVRGDGTKAFFFTPEAMRKVFADAGFSCLELFERSGDPTHVGGDPRRFLQGIFSKD